MNIIGKEKKRGVVKRRGHDKNEKWRGEKRKGKNTMGTKKKLEWIFFPGDIHSV